MHLLLVVEEAAIKIVWERVVGFTHICEHAQQMFAVGTRRFNEIAFPCRQEKLYETAAVSRDQALNQVAAIETRQLGFEVGGECPMK